MKRPYRTDYYDVADASGKLPVRSGHSSSLRNARRNIAMHLVVGDYKLGVVIDKRSEQMVTFLRVQDIQFQEEKP